MTWVDLLGPVAVALGVLFVPGGIVLAAASRLSLRTVALAPAVSMGVVSVGAVAVALVGLPWRWWSMLAFAAVVALAFLVLRRLARGSTTEPGTSPRTWVAAGIGLVVAAVLVARRFVFVVGSPENVSQTFDNVFHLNAIRHVLRTDSGSALDIGGMTGIGFYPGAWHDVVSLVALTTGTTIPAAVTATNLVIATLVWPAGCIYLVSVFLPRRPWLLVVAGILSSAFGAFPLLLLSYGVLYPNFLSVALLPSVLALTASVVGFPDRRRDAFSSALVRDVAVLLVALAGLAMAHPNGALSWMALTAPIVLWWVWQTAASLRTSADPRRGAVLLGAATAAVLLGVALVWRYVRPPWSESQWPPRQSQGQALGESLAGSHLGLPTSWLVALLILSGLVVAIRRPRYLWVCGPFLVSTALFVIISGTPYGPLRYWATGVWYNDSNRIAAIMPVGSLVVASLGALAIVTLVARAVRRLADARGIGERPRSVVRAVLVIVGLLVLLIGSQGENVRQAARQGSVTYAPDEKAVLLSVDEAALIDRLDESTPEGATIAVNPWTGAALAYALADRDVTEPHMLMGVPDAVVELDGSLRDIDVDPAVCEAVMETGVDFVLDFGDRFVNRGANMRIDYEGLEGLEEGRHLRLVDSEGDARLFEIVGCDQP